MRRRTVSSNAELVTLQLTDGLFLVSAEICRKLLSVEKTSWSIPTAILTRDRGFHNLNEVRGQILFTCVFLHPLHLSMEQMDLCFNRGNLTFEEDDRMR